MAEYRIVVINDLVLVGWTRNRLTIFNLPMLPTKILLNYALNTQHNCIQSMQHLN